MLTREEFEGSTLSILDRFNPDNSYTTSTKTFTEEFQIQGNSLNKRLTWTVGVYYERRRPKGMPYLIQSTFGAPEVTNASFVRSSQTAVYGQATLDLGLASPALEGVRLTGGYRRTWDKGTSVNNLFRTATDACVNVAGESFPDCEVEISGKDEVGTWTLGADWRASPDLLLYATYKRGFRPAAFNFFSPIPELSRTRPEFVEVGEIGFKSDLEIGAVRGRLNTAYYRARYSDIQRAVGFYDPVRNLSGSLTQNAAKAIAQGVEVEATVIPFSGFELSGTYAWSDAQYKKFISETPQGPVDLSNVPFPASSKHKFSVAARADIPVPQAMGRPSIQVTYSWQGAYWGLVAGCTDRGIPILMETRARRLVRREGRVAGVAVESKEGSRDIAARRAVLIATGGYEFNEELVRRFVPYPERIFPMTAPGNSGDGHVMGMELGAATALMDCAVWMAALLTPGEPDWGIAPKGVGQSGASFVAMPGQIFVNAAGQRVCDEGFYPAARRAIFAQAADKESAYANLPLFVVFDQAARDRYGVGPLPPGHHEERPWLIKADSIAALAAKTGIDPNGLAATIDRYNVGVAAGVDPDFGRGRQRANPIVTRELAAARGRVRTEDNKAYIAGGLSPLKAPPYYAARLGLASIGNRGGLVTDTAQRVLDWHGKPIAGLLAASNAAAQLAVGGGYTSGQSIGLSLVGGYIAGQAAGEA